VPISYDLDLNLPTDPGLPPGEAYDEFRRIYAALRNLQEGISEAAGLISFTEDDAESVGVTYLYGLLNRGVLIFEAVTNISIGQLVQLDITTNPPKVRQPCTLYIEPAISDYHGARWIGFPLLNCSAGQHVAIGLTTAIVPLPGASPGYAYALNSALNVTAYASAYPPVIVSDPEAGSAIACTVGYCLEPNKLIVNISGFVSYG
jgi:hypothetical protein